MKQSRRTVLLTLLLACFLGSWIPALADDLCSSSAQAKLAPLDLSKIVGQIAGISHLDAANIKQVQSCLKSRGCYDNDPSDKDGIVGPYTTAALYRSAYHSCSSAPPPPPECGDGQSPISYRLTSLDIQSIENPSPPETTAQQTPAQAKQQTPTGSIGVTPFVGDSANQSDPGATPNTQQDAQPDAPADTDEPAVSKQLLAGLTAIQDIDYPTRELFLNALDFYTTEPLEEKDYAPVAQELSENQPSILAHACKSHVLSARGPGWVADWKSNMIYPLSRPVYGFFPFWMSAPEQASTSQPAADSQQNSTKPPSKVPPAQPRAVDFGALERIGWFGITFSREGNLNLAPLQQDKAEVSEQVEMARRFRTSVDLVIYKELSRRQWIDLATGGGADDFIQTLSTSIAETVGKPVPGFFNTVQYWAFPGLLTSATTAWDGATLDLEGFPYDDPVAMSFLGKLLKQLRQALTKKELRKTVWSRDRHLLRLNLMLPFDVFVPSKGAAETKLCVNDETGNQAVIALAQLVPRQRDYNHAATVTPTDHTGIVDSFLVYLPQSTNDTKKQLRQAVEDAFNRNPSILQLVKENPTLLIADWRYQMLRRITYILSPDAWKYQGIYSHPGGQFSDDMLYAEDNFSAVGFWPIPPSTADKANADNPIAQQAAADIATKTRQIFRTLGTDIIQASLAPWLESALSPQVANFFGGWRRELFLLVETVFLLLLLYFVCANWIYELRDFFNKHAWWFLAIVLFNLAILVLLCVFDRKLREFASYIFIVIVFLMVAAGVARQYFLSTVERNLP